MAEISTILGIDYGRVKVGLAIADEETRMAFAFDVLANDRELLPNLKEIVKCENVKTIVIGITEHEKDPKSAEEKKRFGEKLKNELNVEIIFHEEMFTTKMAHDNLAQHGKKGFSKNDDQEAARIILQSWLDKEALFEKSVEALKHTHVS